MARFSFARDSIMSGFSFDETMVGRDGFQCLFYRREWRRTVAGIGVRTSGRIDMNILAERGCCGESGHMFSAATDCWLGYWLEYSELRTSILRLRLLPLMSASSNEVLSTKFMRS